MRWIKFAQRLVIAFSVLLVVLCGVAIGTSQCHKAKPALPDPPQAGPHR